MASPSSAAACSESSPLDMCDAVSFVQERSKRDYLLQVLTDTLQCPPPQPPPPSQRRQPVSGKMNIKVESRPRPSPLSPYRYCPTFQRNYPALPGDSPLVRHTHSSPSVTVTPANCQASSFLAFSPAQLSSLHPAPSPISSAPVFFPCQPSCRALLAPHGNSTFSVDIQQHPKLGDACYQVAIAGFPSSTHVWYRPSGFRYAYTSQNDLHAAQAAWQLLQHTVGNQANTDLMAESSPSSYSPALTTLVSSPSHSVPSHRSPDRKNGMLPDSSAAGLMGC